MAQAPQTKSKRHETGPLNERRNAPAERVILINFGDRPRVVYDMRNKPVSVDIGEVKGPLDIAASSLDRLRRRISPLLAMPESVAHHADAPLMKEILATLKRWNEISEEDAVYYHDKVFGRGFLGRKPGKMEIRFALAKRVKDAAEYISAGAYETAQKLLGDGKPEPVRLSQQGPGVAEVSKDADIVKGDDDDGATGEQDAGGNQSLGDSGNSAGDGAGAGAGDGDAKGETGPLSGDGEPGDGGEGTDTPDDAGGPDRQAPVSPEPQGNRVRVPSVKG